jgi:hypothetical protein
MNENWVRKTITAEFLSDAHLGSGSGGGGVDALVARDRYGRPVVWASHLEGVLRDAARRLQINEGVLFGRAGGEQQRMVFTSLYTTEKSDTRIWRSSARKAFDNRAPEDDTLRVIEYVPKGTRLVGQVECPATELKELERLIQEVDALGGGRSAGAGRVKLTLSDSETTSLKAEPKTGRLLMLLKNRDPLCITATAEPGNLIPSLAFVPGRTLLGAVVAWLVAQGNEGIAALLTSGKISVSDALPLPYAPRSIDSAEVLPAPLSLQSEKPKGLAGDGPWWAQPVVQVHRQDAWSDSNDKLKLKRPEDDLFVFRDCPSTNWIAFRPSRRVRLRNGRPDSPHADAALFAIEQIAEETHFFAELHGSPEDVKRLAEKLAPVLEGRRWLRVGRAGAPVEVQRVQWSESKTLPKPGTESVRLTFTSDLLVRDPYLRWRTALDQAALSDLVGFEIKLGNSSQDSVMVHGFNGTSRLWRMPAAAIRRGSVFEVSGSNVSMLLERVVNNQWLGERTHEGFGRFRLDATLPGLTVAHDEAGTFPLAAESNEELIATTTKAWFQDTKTHFVSREGERKPSLSQWLNLVGELEAHNPNALTSRRKPTTAGGKNWKHLGASAILDKLNEVPAEQQNLYARMFVRWLRAELRMGER